MDNEITKSQEIIDQKRQSDRYFLEYEFIPQLVEGISLGKLAPEILLDTDHWKELINSTVEDNFTYDWDNLHCRGAKIDDTYVMAVYLFPAPTVIPEAAFGAVLINTTTNEATYYTLEYSLDNNWVLGSKNLRGHYNFGRLENPELEKFVEWVVNRTKSNSNEKSC